MTATVKSTTNPIVRPFAGRFAQARHLLVLVGLALALLVTASPAGAQSRYIVMASTTSTEQSGLFGHLLPIFTRETGIAVRVVAQGTGQALATARRGDADLVLVHDREAEDQFVAEGMGLARRDVMFNDFVLIGPRSDPAGVAAAAGVPAGLAAAGQASAAAGPSGAARTGDIVVGLQRIARARQPFVSRGDKSGTHAAELRYWKLAGIDLAPAAANWYRETGSGMGPTLNVASSMNAYALADRGTWLSFRNRGELGIVLQGDPRLFNPYGIIVVNPARHPHVKAEMAQRFADWMVSPAGQKAIAEFKIGGEPLFFPNARR